MGKSNHVNCHHWPGGKMKARSHIYCAAIDIFIVFLHIHSPPQAENLLHLQLCVRWIPFSPRNGSSSFNPRDQSKPPSRRPHCASRRRRPKQKRARDYDLPKDAPSGLVGADGRGLHQQVRAAEESRFSFALSSIRYGCDLSEVPIYGFNGFR